MFRPDTSPSGRPRILVVDDDGDIRMALVEALALEGFELDEAANGKDALARLDGSLPLPQVILLDLMMPVMSGWELLALLRQDARLASIPVVVLSAGPTVGVVGLPPSRLLSKPVDLDELVETLRGCC
jgi:CheY-like chemotaxis protein